jgi:poly-beta-hydroxyalkanoate depolymerase
VRHHIQPRAAFAAAPAKLRSLTAAPGRKVHHMQAGVGHYGVFSGKRWNNEIYPLLRDFVHVNS